MSRPNTSRRPAAPAASNPSADDLSHLLLLYDRPREPLFVGKGDKITVFKLPQKYLTNRYKNLGVELENRFGEDAAETVNVQEVPLPDLGEILDLGRHDNFSLFMPKHRKIAAQLTTIFMQAPTVRDFHSVACYCRDRCNPYLFNYSLSVAILHRPDTHNLDIPNFIESFPGKYIDSEVFAQAREEATIVPDGSRVPIEVPVDYTASNLEPEHRLAYWREDLGVNLHHWHWHLVFPFDGPPEIVAKNRRGELFFYHHHQIMARFNFERLSNKMARIQKWSNWREPIPDAYFPKLDSLVASRSYAPRLSNQRLQNINRPIEQIQGDIDDLELWRNRIFDAIHAGFVLGDKNQQVTLTEFEGIDILGNIMEASILSPNPAFYGDFHNLGHTMLGFIHDPDHRHLESFSTIGDPATSMRDPVFYGFHAYVNDVFVQFKLTLPPYQTQNLDYSGVTVTQISLQSQNTREPNVLNTFWQQSDVDLSRGMDFQPRGSVFVRFTHLQNQPFTYNVAVNNQGPQRQGTCRIFLAPKFDERGNPWLFRDQKEMFIEMDRFVVTLRQGQNTITRRSTDSNLTIPFERTFRNVDLNRPPGGEQLEQFNLCGCGWPQHLLVPKGAPEGFPCHLFVMISDYEGDRVDQQLQGECNDAAIFCGVRNRLYPDRRSMGYPFDRAPRARVDTLQQFLTGNMRVQDVTIRFNDQTLRRPGGGRATMG